MLETYEQHSRKKLIATVVALLVIAGSVIFADQLKSSGSANTATIAQTSPTTSSAAATIPSTTTSTDTTGSTNSSSTAASSFKDGTYTATSDYYVPHGQESIGVSLTVSNGVVTAASIQNSESDRDSALYQEDFASSYKNYVVGKNISGLKLSVISGASDTTQGFNDALAKIASEAQA